MKTKIKPLSKAEIDAAVAGSKAACKFFNALYEPAMRAALELEAILVEDLAPEECAAFSEEHRSAIGTEIQNLLAALTALLAPPKYDIHVRDQYAVTMLNAPQAYLAAAYAHTRAWMDAKQAEKGTAKEKTAKRKRTRK